MLLGVCEDSLYFPNFFRGVPGNMHLLSFASFMFRIGKVFMTEMGPKI